METRLRSAPSVLSICLPPPEGMEYELARWCRIVAILDSLLNLLFSTVYMAV